MVICDHLVEEVRRGLERDYFAKRVRPIEREEYLQAIRLVGLEVPDPVSPLAVVEDDPKDDYLVALAKVTNAIAIVTGDKDLLRLQQLSPPAIEPSSTPIVFDLKPSVSPAKRTLPTGEGKARRRRPSPPAPSREPEPLYRRLPHGASGVSREEVIRHQRARLYGAMIESVSCRGYRATSVAHLIALAGVSRRAFYEQFSNKEQCFLATYDIVVARARKVVLKSWGAERGWENRLHASCKALLNDVADSPKGPHLVLVDSLGIGPRARERMHLAGHVFEKLVAGVLETAPGDDAFPPLTSRAIVGGVRHIAYVGLLDRSESTLRADTSEVLDWIGSYRLPVGAELMAHADASPIPPTPAAFLARGDERARGLGAVVHLTLDEGYSCLDEPHIAEFAGLSYEAFHKQFASKEACFLAVLDEFAQEALAAAVGGFERAVSWPEGVCHAMNVFVQYLAAHQALLRLAFIDLFEVGPGMVGHMTRTIEGFTEFLAREGPPPRHAPALVGEAVAGALWTIVSSYVANNRLSQLPRLTDHLTFTLLAPYIGSEEAVERITAAHG